MPAYYSRAVTPPLGYPASEAHSLPFPQPFGGSVSAHYSYANSVPQYQQQPPPAPPPAAYYMPETGYGKPQRPPMSNVRGDRSSSSYFLSMPGSRRSSSSSITSTYDQARLPPPPIPSAPVTTSGGVAASLDYDVPAMSSFLARMTLYILNLDHPEILAPFTHFVHQVLTARRMPRPTLFLALVYLARRWALGHLPTSSAPHVHIAFKMLVAALLLANKFNDDNTFTNASWHKATGIPVQDLSAIERDWLRATRWELHLARPADQAAYDRWSATWDQFIAEQTARPPPMLAAASRSSSFSGSFTSLPPPPAVPTRRAQSYYTLPPVPNNQGNFDVLTHCAAQAGAYGCYCAACTTAQAQAQAQAQATGYAAYQQHRHAHEQWNRPAPLRALGAR